MRSAMMLAAITAMASGLSGCCSPQGGCGDCGLRKDVVDPAYAGCCGSGGACCQTGACAGGRLLARCGGCGQDCGGRCGFRRGLGLCNGCGQDCGGRCGLRRASRCNDCGQDCGGRCRLLGSRRAGCGGAQCADGSCANCSRGAGGLLGSLRGRSACDTCQDDCGGAGCGGCSKCLGSTTSKFARGAGLFGTGPRGPVCGCGSDTCGLGGHGHGHGLGHRGAPYTPEFAGPSGPAAPTYAYPYYTTRAPRDFLMANPPSIGW